MLISAKTKRLLFTALLCAGLFAFLSFEARAVNMITFSQEDDGQTLIIENAPEMNVISFGKKVVVRGKAKEVFSWGGDVVVEGTVESDVATLGGSVVQKHDSKIGGAVIVIGGSYRPESAEPLRGPDKETVVFGMFEEEFRDLAKNPSQIFSPAFTPAFFAQRALSALFWFIVTFTFVSLAPGSVSRAIARTNLTPLKVFGIGGGLFALFGLFVVVSLRYMPDYLGAVVSLMAFVLLLLAYVFGRIVLQVSLGKAIQKYLGFNIARSEPAAILLGVLAWTIILSVPYVWTMAAFALFIGGIGLVATGRVQRVWGQP